MSLRVYTVHTPPAGASRTATRDPLPELVKEGFSWPAFFFGFLWALYHRLWLAAAALVALIAVLGALLDAFAIGEVSQSLVFLAISVMVGFLGNDWRRAALRRRGYGEAGVVTAANMETGLRRYLDLHAIGALPRGPSSSGPSNWGARDAGPWGSLPR